MDGGDAARGVAVRVVEQGSGCVVVENPVGGIDSSARRQVFEQGSVQRTDGSTQCGEDAGVLQLDGISGDVEISDRIAIGGSVRRRVEQETVSAKTARQDVIAEPAIEDIGPGIAGDGLGRFRCQSN